MASPHPYDTRCIGHLIGWGGEHLVYAYGTDKVIKFSWHVFFSGRFGVRKLLKDYALGKKYFSKYILPTDIRTWHRGSRAVEIQEKVVCRSFTRDDLANPLLREQLREIFALHEYMRRDSRKSFDLFGFKGLFGRLAHWEISNIKVLPDDRVVILDFTVLTLLPRWYEWPLFFFIRWARRRQKKLIKLYWHDIL